LTSTATLVAQPEGKSMVATFLETEILGPEDMLGGWLWVVSSGGGIICSYSTSNHACCRRRHDIAIVDLASSHPCKTRQQRYPATAVSYASCTTASKAPLRARLMQCIFSALPRSRATSCPMTSPTDTVLELRHEVGHMRHVLLAACRLRKDIGEWAVPTPSTNGVICMLGASKFHLLHLSCGCSCCIVPM